MAPKTQTEGSTHSSTQAKDIEKAHEIAKEWESNGED